VVQRPRDEKNVIVEIRGHGGDEAALSPRSVSYTRFGERHGWKFDHVRKRHRHWRLQRSDLEIKAECISKLKYESGVHRVQRIPSTESSGRIHTSTATVAVLAAVEDVDIQIPEADIRMDVFRSSGAGGQNVQKNATAVRITHLPTGMVVACQDERSQLQNKLRALSILRARLFQMEEDKRRTELDRTRRSQIGSGERSEDRTYNYLRIGHRSSHGQLCLQFAAGHGRRHRRIHRGTLHPR
jgi:peptide chain release factor 1